MPAVLRCLCEPKNCIEAVRTKWIPLDEFRDYGLTVFHCRDCDCYVVEGQETRPMTYMEYRTLVDRIRGNEEKRLDLEHILEEIRQITGRKPNQHTAEKMINCLSVGSQPMIKKLDCNNGTRAIYELRAREEVALTSAIVYPSNGKISVVKGYSKFTLSQE